MSPRLTFAPLHERDLPLLHKWLNAPHMRAFYQKTPTSLAEVETKFLPRIRGELPAYDHLALRAGRPFGKLQCYRVQDYRDFADEIGEARGVAVDLFIGEPEMLGRGLGRAMLRAYVHEGAFSIFPDEHNCLICHDLKNVRARACSVAAGFLPVRHVMEQGIPGELLVLRKHNSCPLSP